MSARELITEHLDLWTGAVTKKPSSGRGSNGKVELTGVKKLRELILELAVRGKLVHQNPNEEPAILLAEKIATERATLMQAGAIKKSPKLPQITSEEVPFDIPSGWHWVRLGELVKKIGSGATPRGGKNAYVQSGIPFLRSQNIWNDGLNLQDVAYIPPETHERMANTHVFPNDILLNITGASLGRCTVVPGDLDTANVSQHVTIIRTIEPLNRSYLHYLILSPYVQSLVWGRQVGMAREGLSKKVLEQFEIPLPPLEEQHRIVQKVDELMALCDRLEQQTSDQLEAHETLVDTLLDTLTQSENATELADNWARLAAHFDTLFTTEQSIDKLKQTILQLAVMGRLVEQDVGDEPARTLVSKMLKVRDNLASTEGMRTKASNEVPSSERYLNLPDSWAWIRLGNMAKFIDYRGKTPTKTSRGRRLITAKNIRQGYVDLEPEEFISEVDYTKWMTRGFPRKGDLLFTPEAPLGNAAIIDLEEEFALAQRAICFQWHALDTSRFMLIQILASPFQAKLVENATGMTATGIKASKLKEIPVAIPPIEEQHRIVQKVDELMTLCDQLKERLSQASETRCQLAEAVVEKALH